MSKLISQPASPNHPQQQATDLTLEKKREMVDGFIHKAFVPHDRLKSLMDKIFKDGKNTLKDVFNNFTSIEGIKSSPFMFEINAINDTIYECILENKDIDVIEMGSFKELNRVALKLKEDVRLAISGFDNFNFTPGSVDEILAYKVYAEIRLYIDAALIEFDELAKAFEKGHRDISYKKERPIEELERFRESKINPTKSDAEAEALIELLKKRAQQLSICIGLMERSDSGSIYKSTKEMLEKELTTTQCTIRRVKMFKSFSNEPKSQESVQDLALTISDSISSYAKSSTFRRFWNACGEVFDIIRGKSTLRVDFSKVKAEVTRLENNNKLLEKIIRLEGVQTGGPVSDVFKGNISMDSRGRPCYSSDNLNSKYAKFTTDMKRLFEKINQFQKDNINPKTPKIKEILEIALSKARDLEGKAKEFKESLIKLPKPLDKQLLLTEFDEPLRKVENAQYELYLAIEPFELLRKTLEKQLVGGQGAQEQADALTPKEKHEKAVSVLLFNENYINRNITDLHNKNPTDVSKMMSSASWAYKAKQALFTLVQGPQQDPVVPIHYSATALEIKKIVADLIDAKLSKSQKKLVSQALDFCSDVENLIRTTGENIPLKKDDAESIVIKFMEKKVSHAKSEDPKIEGVAMVRAADLGVSLPRTAPASNPATPAPKPLAVESFAIPYAITGMESRSTITLKEILKGREGLRKVNEHVGAINSADQVDGPGNTPSNKALGGARNLP